MGEAAKEGATGRCFETRSNVAAEGSF